MDEEPDSQTRVHVTMTLDVDGDWRADPLRLLVGIRRGQQKVEEIQREAVASARGLGVSWEAIGGAIGVSRQAAWERFSD